jgi:hypothetical protein
MSNYTAANLVKAQVALLGQMAAPEKRFRDPKIHKLFFSNSENFFPNYKELRTREDRTLEANFYKRSARALSNNRSHAPSGSIGDSGTLQPTWLSKSDAFELTMKQQDISVLQNHLNDGILNSVANHLEGWEEIASNTLLNNRTGVNNATSDGVFNATNDVFEINENAQGSQAPFIAKMVMEINKYTTDLVFVCDPIAFRKFMFLANQGVSNATNFSFQFMGMEFILDAGLTAKAQAVDASYTKGFWEVVPRNTVGGLDWIPRQNREGRETKLASFSQITNPFDGLQYAFYRVEELGDGTSRNGQRQDVIETYELSLDVAYVLAPLSNPNESVVYAFALV